MKLVINLSGSRRILLLFTVLIAATRWNADVRSSQLEAAEPTATEGSLPGLVPAPARLPGIGRWQMVRALPVGILWAAAWSPDGKRIALSDYQYVRICDTQTMATVQFLVGHSDRVTSIAYSRDGSKIASSSFDGTVRVWQEDGVPQLVLNGHAASVNSVCWSPDGKQLASAGDDGTVRIWDAAGNAVVTFKDHEAPVYCVAWSSDGERLASGDANRMVRIWSRDGKSIAACEGHHGKVTCISWSPDGQTVASGDMGFKDPVDNSYVAGVRFWNRDGKEQKSVVASNEPVFSLSYSPDGELLASGGEEAESANLWNKGGVLLTQLRAPGQSIAWSPDSKKLVATGRGQAMISGIDGAAGPTLVGGRGRNNVTVAWSPDGSLLAANSLAGNLQLWKTDGERGPAFKEPITQATAVAWSADSQRVLAGKDDDLRFWNRDGTAGKSLEAATGCNDRIVCSRDGRLIASACSYNTATSPIQLRNSDGKVLKTLAGHSNGTTMLAWSPDGKLLASSGRDGTARLWTSEGEQHVVIEGLTKDVDSIAWSADSLHIVVGYDSGDMQFWNIDGTPGPEISAHSSSIMSCAFSPDGKRLATGSWDESIKLWDKENQELRKLAGHLGPMYSLSWHPDGKRLASGSYDGTARVWDTDTGDLQLIIFALDNENALAVTRTGEIHGGNTEAIDRDFLFLVEKPNHATEIVSYTVFKKRIADAESRK